MGGFRSLQIGIDRNPSFVTLTRGLGSSETKCCGQELIHSCMFISNLL